MRGLLAILAISVVLLSSGCVRETGNVAINFTDTDIPLEEPGLEFSEEDNETTEGPETGSENETLNETEEPESTEEDVTWDGADETTEDAEHDPCADKLCDDSITTCPDNVTMTCGNTCDPETGNCSTCIPQCPEADTTEEGCDLECGPCQVLDEDDCECLTEFFCEGNGICTSDEWPDGEDCLAFDGCDDSDDCTQDILDTNNQVCVHTYECCGNGFCDPGDASNCSEELNDCFEEGEESGDVTILSLDPDEELVTLEGYGADLTGWSLEDAAPTPHVYAFPDDFLLDGTAYLHTIGCPEDNNETDLFWGTIDGGCRTGEIWNPHDTATLRDGSGETVDTYEY